MKNKAIRQLYRHVGGEERFRLALEAYGRDDLSELEHLVEAAPRATVEVRDPGMVAAYWGAERLVWAFVARCAPLLGWMTLLEVFRRTCWDEPPESEEGSLYPAGVVMELAWEAGSRELKTLERAFQEVCRDRVGVNGGILLRLHARAFGEALHRWVTKMGEEAVDPECLEAAVEFLDAHWREARSLLRG